MKLTVVIIGRNDISHLGRSIRMASESAARCPGCSVLYADDASTDSSYEFAEMLAGKLGNVALFRSDIQRNIGGIRNAAVEHLKSTGDACPEYVWFHDSDDYVTAQAVSRIVEALDKNGNPDCVSVPVYALRDPSADVPDCSVPFGKLEEAVNGPVGEWSIAFKTSLYVANPEGQCCEDCPWHFEQFDKFETWAKVEGKEPCYVWDNTNPNATTRTVDYCNHHSVTLMSAALDNVLVNAGKNDRWISDNLRNLANMYDVRHRLRKPAVRNAWEMRFRTEVSNFMNGWHVH